MLGLWQCGCFGLSAEVSTSCSLRRAVFEHGEKLRALVGVRGVETASQQAQPGAERQRSAVDNAIERAGAHCSPQACAVAVPPAFCASGVQSTGFHVPVASLLLRSSSAFWLDRSSLISAIRTAMNMAGPMTVTRVDKKYCPVPAGASGRGRAHALGALLRLPQRQRRCSPGRRGCAGAERRCGRRQQRGRAADAVGAGIRDAGELQRILMQVTGGEIRSVYAYPMMSLLLSCLTWSTLQADQSRVVHSGYGGARPCWPASSGSQRVSEAARY